MVTESGTGKTKAFFSPLRNNSQITPSARDDSDLQPPAKEVLQVTDASQQALGYELCVRRTLQEEMINLPKGGTMCSDCIVGWLFKLNFNRTFKNNFSVNHNVCE